MGNKTSKVLGILAGTCAAALLAASLAGCSGSGAGAPPASAGGSQVAAEVNGKNIMEADITADIESFRKQSQLDTEGTWVQWLNDNHFTPADVREVKIQEKIQEILLEEVCSQNGIEVSNDEVAAKVSEVKELYNGGDFTFDQMLESSGMTEESYTAQVKEDMLKSALADYIKTEKMNPSDESLLAIANEDMKDRDGMKNYKVIYATSEDSINAASRELASGASFDAVQSKYNSSGNAYDGWGSIESYSDPVIKAISSLAEDTASEPVMASANQYFIIMYTDVLSVPANGYASFDAIPEDFRGAVRDNALNSLAYSEVYVMVDAARQAATINIHEMPEGLSYAVDPALLSNESTSEPEPANETASGSAESAAANAASENAASSESSASGESAVSANENASGASEGAASASAASASAASASAASASAASASGASAGSSN